MIDSGSTRATLSDWLRRRPKVVVALSGGIDSMVLAHVAAGLPEVEARLIHATSPAVPQAAFARVKAMQDAGLPVEFVDAGEFSDPRYLANPANRCFFCKSNLYSTLGRLSERLGATVVSGANLDDLEDWRPGLQAAENHGVLHPYIEAGMRKADVRALATELGLGAIADLPSSPCLSSRLETGLMVEAETLIRIDRTEEKLRRLVRAERVRCRSRKANIVLEIDDACLNLLNASQRDHLVASAREEWVSDPRPIVLAAYQRGSAFLR